MLMVSLPEPPVIAVFFEPEITSSHRICSSVYRCHSRLERSCTELNAPAPFTVMVVPALVTLPVVRFVAALIVVLVVEVAPARVPIVLACTCRIYGQSLQSSARNSNVTGLRAASYVSG